MDQKPHSYNIHTDVLFSSLKKIDVDRIRHEHPAGWFNQTLCRVNDSVVRLGVVQGEFHWHKHDEEDEFFFVVAGKLWVDIENEAGVELLPNQGYTVPRGVIHRTRAVERTAMLMMASAAVVPTGS